MKSKLKVIKLTILLTGVINILSLPSQASEPTVCYNIEMKESPESESTANPHFEVWCYQKLISPEGTYIYNADTNEVKPELAIVLEQNGIMTHASLLAGKLTVHRLYSPHFNPYSIPLEAPTHLQPLPQNFDASLANSAKETLNFLLLNSSTSVEALLINEGTYRAQAKIPWRGYWWPYKGRPLSGSFYSPMAKYDRFVSSRSGSNPGAVAWENSHHYYKGVWWEGHCNGWAASSILRSEPKFSRTDASTGIIFSVSDIKGLLAETDYCASAAFFGRRNNGSGDIQDIYPALFHKTITYYVGKLKKPVAMDYHRDAVVDNHIISGYEMNITRTGDYTYSVITTLRMNKYDGFRTNIPGNAPRYYRTYQYTLRTDEGGNIINGAWISTNPDFLWVPLSSNNCVRKNQGIKDSWINTIINL